MYLIQYSPSSSVSEHPLLFSSEEKLLSISSLSECASFVVEYFFVVFIVFDFVKILAVHYFSKHSPLRRPHIFRSASVGSPCSCSMYHRKRYELFK